MWLWCEWTTKGDLLIEAVTGSQWSTSDVWVMISKGHMTLLQPPSLEEGRALLEKEEVYNTPCLGFRYFWHQRRDQAKTAPGMISCRHCRSRKGGSAEDTETTGCLRKTTCLPALSQVFAGGGQVVRAVHEAGGHKGLALQEYFAVMSHHQGLASCEPDGSTPHRALRATTSTAWAPPGA